MADDQRFPTSTFLTLGTFAALLVGLHVAAPARGLDPATLRPGLDAVRLDASGFKPVQTLPLPGVPPTLALESPNRPGWSPAMAATVSLATADLFDEPQAGGQGALQHFYAALQDLSSGKRKSPVRIVHYGDSPTTADLITGDAREMLQERFGDAGSGFVFPAKPWAWYGHHGIDVSGDGWKIATAVGQMHEAPYGLGGASFTGESGAQSTIKVAARNARTIEVQFLRKTGGGTLEVLADGNSAGTVDTSAGEDKAASDCGAETVDLPAGAREITLRVKSGSVTLFGVTLESGRRGLTYDSLGLNGASTTVMSRGFSPETFSQALRHRAPDLVIINYGTNESSYPSFVDRQYEGELRRAIARVRSAVPEASILIMSPMDRGSREGGQTISTMPAIPRIVAIQQRVAAELGCGFFSTYAAMGGDGTMERWYDGHPRLVAADLIHPTPQGARMVAQILTTELLTGYARFLEEQRREQQKGRQTAARNAPHLSAQR